MQIEEMNRIAEEKMQKEEEEFEEQVRLDKSESSSFHASFLTRRSLSSSFSWKMPS